jgi:hypothetical protein
VGAEGFQQVIRAAVGMAVHAVRRGLDRGDGERGRSERVLVRRELDRARDPQLPLQLLDRLPGHVRLQGADFRSY